ncbi:28319_t:CDS:1, partial [Gigaspora margarita]
MDDQILTNTANIINALAAAITNRELEKNLLTISFFTKDRTQDPLE